MAIDWSLYEVKDEGGLQSQLQPTPFNQRATDWSQYEVPQEEDNEELEVPEETGVIGIAHDVQDAFANALGRGADWLEQAPGNIDLIKKDISQNGLKGLGHILGQLHAANASLAKGIVNTPHDFAKYLIRKGLGFEVPVPGTGKNLSDLIPHIPEDTGVEKALGLEAQPERGDEFTRAIPGIVAGAQGVKSLVGAGRKAFKAPDLRETIRETQAKVNQAEAKTGEVFDKVEREVGKRGLSSIPIDQKVIENAKGFLPATKANQALIEKASTGDYAALRKLQGDLRVKAEKALASKFKAEHDEGELILETREDINQGIADYLEENGHKDLANDLKQARNDYRDIKKTYFSTPALAKAFGKSQVVPKNPMTLLTEESTEMKRFMAKHPEVEKMLSKALRHKKVSKNIGKLAAALGIGTTGGVTYKLLGGK